MNKRTAREGDIFSLSLFFFSYPKNVRGSQSRSGQIEQDKDAVSTLIKYHNVYNVHTYTQAHIIEYTRRRMQLGCGVFFFSSYNGLIWLSVRVKDGIKWAQELYSVTNGVEGRRDQRLLNCFETLAVVTCSHWDVGTRFSMTHNAWSESYGLEERGNRQGGSQQVDVSAPWLHTSIKTSCLQNWSGSSGFLTFMSIPKGACRELAKYDGHIYFRQTRTTLFNFSVPSEIQIWITQEIPSGQPAPQFVTLQFVLKKGAFSEIFGNNFDDKSVACVAIDP